MLFSFVERQKQRHDPPVIIYRREPSEPTEREAAAAEADQEPEITLTVESEKHTGFSIEFSDSHSPKMAKKESLSDFVPKSLKERMAESSRLAEERRAIRMSRSKSQEFVKVRRLDTVYLKFCQICIIHYALTSTVSRFTLRPYIHRSEHYERCLILGV